MEEAINKFEAESKEFVKEKHEKNLLRRMKKMIGKTKDKVSEVAETVENELKPEESVPAVEQQDQTPDENIIVGVPVEEEVEVPEPSPQLENARECIDEVLELDRVSGEVLVDVKLTIGLKDLSDVLTKFVDWQSKNVITRMSVNTKQL